MNNRVPFRQSVGITIGTFIVIFALTYISMPSDVDGEYRPGDDRLSLDLRETALGDVLHLIEKKTGYKFIIEDRWKDVPVSISIKNKPLHEVLRRILNKFNSAVIYSPDGKLRIFIYDISASNETTSDNAIPEPASNMPASQLPLPSNDQEQQAASEITEQKDSRQPDNETAKQPARKIPKPKEPATEDDKEKSEEEESSDKKPEKTDQ